MPDHSPKPRTMPERAASVSSSHPAEAVEGTVMRLTGQSQPRPAPDAWNARLIFRLKSAAQGCNFHEIARRTDANAETVRRYFRDGNPSVAFVARFCAVFSVSADWLLNGKHWSGKRRAGGPLPDGKLNLTLALSKGRVRVLNQGQSKTALAMPAAATRSTANGNGRGTKDQAAEYPRGRAGPLGNSALRAHS